MQSAGRGLVAVKYERKGRVFGIYKSEVFKLTIAFWYLYVTFDWTQSPYAVGRCLNIFMVVG